MASEGQAIKKKSMVVIGLVFLLGLVLMTGGVFEPLERKSIDLRLGILRQDRAPDVPIAMILVDDASLDALAPMVGRWPWPRRVHGELIDFLAICGAKAIVVDLLFSEVQNGTQIATESAGTDDQRLSTATAQAGNVYHALQLVRRQEGFDPAGRDATTLPADFMQRFGLTVSGDAGPDYQDAYPPYADLYPGAKGMGVVSFDADSDGVFRRERLLFTHQKHHFGALGLAPALDLLEIESLVHEGNTLVLEAAHGGKHRIPLDAEKRYRINPYGHFEAYSYSGVYLSARQFLNGQFEQLAVDPAQFENRVVFIGASAGGIGDLKTSALDTRTPGVFLHAAVLANLLSDDYLHFPPFWADATIALLLLGLTVAAVFHRPTYLQKICLPLMLVAGYAALAVAAMRFNWVVNLWAPLAIMTGGFMVAITVLSFGHGRERRRIRRILGQYVSPAVLSTVLTAHSEDCLRAEVGTHEQLTLFFSDLRGFTAITEQYPVETVVEALNAYLSRMVSIIFAQGGTLDKFIGDAIMAFWGAPLKDDDQHRHAIAAALQMQAAMGQLNREGGRRGYPNLRMGIGIHSGEVILGNIGSTKKLDYTVIGDSVNFTARLESLTKFYQAEILISEATYQNVVDDFCCRPVDRVCVQGKTEPIQIYEVLDLADTKNENLRHLAALSMQGFNSYQERNFKGALKLFEKMRHRYPQDAIGPLFAERCKLYLDSPPPAQWQGEFVCQSK